MLWFLAHAVSDGLLQPLHILVEGAEIFVEHLGGSYLLHTHQAVHTIDAEWL